MASIKIIFNNPSKKYKSGDIITCKILTQVPKSFKATCMSVRFMGVAHTGWTKRKLGISNEEMRSLKEHSKATQTLFKYYHVLFGHKDGPTITVETGSYSYKVDFQLPEDIPTSFEHEYGYIRYTVKAQYNVSWSSDEGQTEPFTVKSHIDLNQNLKLLRPLKTEIQKTFDYFICSRSDPLKLAIHLPRRGFAPNESVPVIIKVDNNSNITIKSVRLEFYELLTFHVKTPDVDEQIFKTKFIDHLFKASTGPCQKQLYQTEIHLNPGFRWKMFTGCDIITCMYNIKATAIPKGMYRNMSVQTYIQLATIPPTEENFPSININVPGPKVLQERRTSRVDIIVERTLPNYSGVLSESAQGSMTDLTLYDIPMPDSPNSLIQPAFEDIQRVQV